jgi:hypothetical protein
VPLFKYKKVKLLATLAKEIGLALLVLIMYLLISYLKKFFMDSFKIKFQEENESTE